MKIKEISASDACEEKDCETPRSGDYFWLPDSQMGPELFIFGGEWDIFDALRRPLITTPPDIANLMIYNINYATPTTENEKEEVKKK